MQLREKSLNELKARLFAYEYSKTHDKVNGYKPFGVTGFQINQENWKSYKILLVNDKSKNIVLQVCFPSDRKENFAIVQETKNNKNCDSQIAAIEKYKIVDDKTTKLEMEKKRQKHQEKLNKKIQKKFAKKEHPEKLSFHTNLHHHVKSSKHTHAHGKKHLKKRKGERFI